MKYLVILLAVALSPAAVAQTAGPTSGQLRTLQLHLNEQQQHLNQLRLQQPSTTQRGQQLQSLQSRLDQQQIELQRLKQQQSSCPRGRC